MSRSAWSRCAPSSLPVTTEEHGTGFHQVHASDGARIRHRRVCEREDVEVPQSEIAHCWQRPDGRTVVLLDEDLAALPLATKRTVDVLGFVDERDVDPVLYAKPYWVGAAGEQGQRPYALLVEALARHGTIAVAKVTLRTRERLAVLRPRHGMLVLHTLLWPEEIREPDDLSSNAPVTDRELELAKLLMDQLAGVEIAELHDDYAAALEQLVAAKLTGAGLEEPEEPVTAVDLMAALEASIRAANKH
ncbi:Ku protein [Actinacidiphila glaucinigra]|uniref:non-homologous end joining protein Ku n=1 Tax=Actinacidiphila glaucinigra TaxID=235986 RepID=UPI002DDA0134|nr:Ku protein [Actinacidiphila glaucinigra]WSD57598.1 Ku protein [Actinacidiphila glaucinigra]